MSSTTEPRRSNRKASENASNALKQLATKTRPTAGEPKTKRGKDGESKPKAAKKAAGSGGKRGRPSSKTKKPEAPAEETAAVTSAEE